MANLIRLQNLAKLSGCLNRSMMIGWQRSSSSKTPNDSNDDLEIIHQNEHNYFEEVKKSFDGLKTKRVNESLEEKRSRLLYQSRKRGTLENGLLISNFSAKYLPKMSEQELNEFDKIINDLHNEWDLYYWLTNTVEIPEHLKSNQVLAKMKDYCLNKNREIRIMQPDIQQVLSSK